MNLTDYPNIPVDRDRLIDAIHTLQVDLQLLADWLARDVDPVMNADMLESFRLTSAIMKRLTPSYRCH